MVQYEVVLYVWGNNFKTEPTTFVKILLCLGAHHDTLILN